MTNNFVANGAYLQSFQDQTAQNKGISCQLLVFVYLQINPAEICNYFFMFMYTVYIQYIHQDYYVFMYLSGLSAGLCSETLTHYKIILFVMEKIRSLNQMRRRLSPQ